MLFGLKWFNLEFYFLTQKNMKILEEEAEKLEHS